MGKIKVYWHLNAESGFRKQVFKQNNSCLCGTTFFQKEPIKLHLPNLSWKISRQFRRFVKTILKTVCKGHSNKREINSPLWEKARGCKPQNPSTNIKGNTLANCTRNRILARDIQSSKLISKQDLAQEPEIKAADKRTTHLQTTFSASLNKPVIVNKPCYQMEGSAKEETDQRAPTVYAIDTWEHRGIRL